MPPQKKALGFVVPQEIEIANPMPPSGGSAMVAARAQFCISCSKNTFLRPI
jgi:hypothetical protein